MSSKMCGPRPRGLQRALKTRPPRQGFSTQKQRRPRQVITVRMIRRPTSLQQSMHAVDYTCFIDYLRLGITAKKKSMSKCFLSFSRSINVHVSLHKKNIFQVQQNCFWSDIGLFLKKLFGLRTRVPGNLNMSSRN